MQKLYRSRSNRVLFGVCGGLSEYFRIDPTIIRIIFILVGLTGSGILIYLVASLIMPEEGKDSKRREEEWNTGSSNYTDSSKTEGFKNDFGDSSEKWDEPVKYNSEKNKLVFGAILVGLGVIILGKQILPGLFKLDLLVPLLLVGIGGIIVFKGRRK
jgi:phage shock protein C